MQLYYSLKNKKLRFKKEGALLERWRVYEERKVSESRKWGTEASKFPYMSYKSVKE